MFKKIFASILALIVLVAVAAGIYQTTQVAAAQSGADALAIAANPYGGQGNGYAQNGSGAAQAQSGQHALPSISGELSDAEAQGLIFMREEEKLARDVYLALYETWGLPVFQNIATSEQAHMDSIKTLLDGYGLADPAQAQPGAFTNPDLQALYDELVARGSQSLAEAVKVGGAIEEIDILDLQEYLAATSNTSLQQVYTNLLRGSENHLRSFANTLQTQTGETYQPQYLSPDAYQAILASSQGNGNGNGNSGQGGRGGQGGQGGSKGWRGGRP